MLIATISALLFEAIAVGPKFAADRAVGTEHVFAVPVDEVKQHTAAFDMAEETIAEAGAFVGTGDQPWNVGNDETRRPRRRQRRAVDAAW